MSIQDDARRELALAGITGNDANAMLYILKLFFAQWDSGGAVSVMVPVLEKLLHGEPLTPLTGADDEWYKPLDGVDMLQNVRCGTVFKESMGQAWDMNHLNPDGSYVKITFPYTPVRKSLDPVVTFEMKDKAQ